MRVSYCWLDEDSIGYRIAMPVDRYYLPEGEGPIAEQATNGWIPTWTTTACPATGLRLGAHPGWRGRTGRVYVDDLPLQGVGAASGHLEGD